MRTVARRTAPVLFAAGALAPGSAWGQRAELEKFIRHRVLANGLEVIVAQSRGVPIATIEFDVRNGSFTQRPGTEGLAHMYEHMFFKANAQLPEPDAFVKRASELGATFNGTTQEERVNYYMTLPSDSLAGGLRLMAAAIRWPRFLGEELEREREVVLGEYDRNESNPFFELQQAMGKALYPGQWSRKNVIGERTVLQRVTPAQMLEIQRRYYVPNNTALIVTGDVDPDTVFALAERFLGDWPRGEDPFAAEPIPAIPALASSSVVYVERPVGAVTVMLQWQGPSVRKDPAATFAADVFSDALNQPGSLLQRRLVDTGLFQSINVNYYTLNQVGPITIAGQTTPERLKEAMAALQQEVQRLADPGYITPEQLQATKAERAVSTAFGFDRPSEHAKTIGFWWSVSGLEYYMGYVDNMGAQSLEDVRAYARKYIVGKPMVVGILLPPGVKGAIGLSDADVLPRIVP
ncbi:MAG: insulinase family protein [Gemmatimonadaceae bacterium]|nr:insulinase family protein [Gemmatimonadaceae bacterium]